MLLRKRGAVAAVFLDSEDELELPAETKQARRGDATGGPGSRRAAKPLKAFSHAQAVVLHELVAELWGGRAAAVWSAHEVSRFVATAAEAAPKRPKPAQPSWRPG